MTPEALRRETRHAAANLLTALSGTLDLLAARAAPGTPEAARLERARRAAEELRGLVEAYLAIPAEPRAEEQDAAALVLRLLPLLEAVSDRRVTWRVEAADGLPRVSVARPGFDLALLGGAREAAAAVERGAALAVTLDAAEGGVLLSAGGFRCFLPAAQP
jgi:hypothetical protein